MSYTTKREVCATCGVCRFQSDGEVTYPCVARRAHVWVEVSYHAGRPVITNAQGRVDVRCSRGHLVDRVRESDWADFWLNRASRDPNFNIECDQESIVPGWHRGR